jgi:hypothetical protein
MLLTKPLTTFLARNTSPQLPTLLLISPNGKLLSSSSPLSASVLRTQSTVACTLWNLYHPFQLEHGNLVASALASPATTQGPRSTAVTGATTVNDKELGSITIQLSHGIMVIRALSCGLLFVAIGPTIIPSAPTSSPFPNLHTLVSPNIPSSHTSPPSSPPAHYDGHDGIAERDIAPSTIAAIGSGAPSEAGSVGSSVTGGRTQASILGVKRQADEVGRWLEDKLRGFVLNSAEGR